jgi:oxalate decarboxylase
MVSPGAGPVGNATEIERLVTMNSNRRDAVGFTRRRMIGAVSLGAVGTAMMSAPGAGAQQPSRHVGKDPGKHDPLPDFKFDLENAKGWEGEGGSAKEATVEEFPASLSIAGVSMRLKPGAIRELHWHAIAAEWAFVISGQVRTTVINPNGQASAAVDDFEPGDIWYFQGLRSFDSKYRPRGRALRPRL